MRHGRRWFGSINFLLFSFFACFSQYLCFINDEIEPIEYEERYSIGSIQYSLYIFESHHVHEDTKVHQHIVCNDILHNRKLILGPKPIYRWVYFSQPEQLLSHPQINYPVEKGHKIPRIESMPKCTSHQSSHLCSTLHFLFLPLIFEFGLRVVDLFINIPFEGHLDTHVPAIYFLFDGGGKEKVHHFSYLYLFESVRLFRIT